VRLTLTPVQYQFVLDVIGSITTLLFGTGPPPAIPEIPDENNSEPESTPLDSVVRMLTDILVEIPALSFAVFGDRPGSEGYENYPISELQLDQFKAKISTWSNGIQEFEFLSSHLGIIDTRKDKETCFKTFMSTSGEVGHNQVELRLKRWNGITDLLMAFDSLKLFFDFSYLLMIRDFFLKPFQNAPDTIDMDDIPQLGGFSYRVDFVNVELM
jgi:hypothetical protein